MTARLRDAARQACDDAIRTGRRSALPGYEMDWYTVEGSLIDALRAAVEEEERIIELMKSEAGEDVTVVGGLIDKMGDGSPDVASRESVYIPTLLPPAKAPDGAVSRCDGSGRVPAGSLQHAEWRCPGCPACRKEKP